MEAAARWSAFFQNWPEQWNRQGVLLTSFGEQIPFEGFMVSKDLLLLQRTTPDSIGTRQLIIDYPCIAALKINHVVDPSVMTEKGFSGVLPKK